MGRRKGRTINMNTNTLFASLLNVPPERWQDHGVRLLAMSSGGNMLVNSFIASIRGKRFYGFRKHEIRPDYTFTGKQWFEVERI